jgi:plasmid maintenance system antidote protein VapI
MKLGWIRARLNEFINGKRGITADAALDLAEALGTSPKLWMNLQATWNLAQAERRRSVAWTWAQAMRRRAVQRRRRARLEKCERADLNPHGC